MYSSSVSIYLRINLNSSTFKKFVKHYLLFKMHDISKIKKVVFYE